MIYQRRLIPSIISLLLFTGMVRADMVSVVKLEVERQASPFAGDRAEGLGANSPSSSESLIDIQFDAGPVRFLPEADAKIRQSTQVSDTLLDLTNRPGSASLCLYALMGLGLWSAPHWIKKLHLGHIPEWYHDGGPFQIGHSFAVSPESLCPVSVDCFVQPDDTVEELIPQYHLRTIVSCWRQSQFTLEVQAARGPPPFQNVLFEF